MKKIIVCQHVAYEILGTLDPLLRSYGFRIKYVNFGRNPDLAPKMNNYDGLIILGGPMSVYDEKTYPFLRRECHLIEEAIKANVPVLGICLGAQQIAKTLGAKIYCGQAKEIGWHQVLLTAAGKKDPLLHHLHSHEKLFQWHQDGFDLPGDSVHLAKSEVYPNQAFRYGNKVYAFQFHLEVDEPMILRWLAVAPNKEDLEKEHGHGGEARIKKDTAEYIGPMMKTATQVFEGFVRLFY